MKKLISSIKDNKSKWYIAVIAGLFLSYSLACWFFFLKDIGGIAFSHVISNALLVVQASEDVEESNADTDEYEIDDDEQAGNKVEHLLDMVDDATDAISSVWYGSMRSKTELARMDTLFTYLFTGEISSTQTLKGKDGWLFYKTTTDGDPIADYEGTNSFDLDTKNWMRGYNLYTEYMLGEMGIEYRLLTVPNKEIVYSKYMPDRFVKGENNRLDDLVEFLEEDGVNVVYAKDALLTNCDKYDLFYKYDTHWNKLGGYVATREVVDSLGIKLPKLSELEISSHDLKDDGYGIIEDDLAALCGLRTVMADEQEYVFENMPEVDYSNYIEEQTSGECYSHYTNPEALTQQSVLLVGDSFRTSMIPALLMAYSDVYVAHRAYFDRTYIDVINPDCLIAEYVERYAFEIDSAVYLVWDGWGY